MSKTFSQLNLPTLDGVNLAKSGCGACALASIVYNRDTKVTPKSVAQWLIKKGYLSNQGTSRIGITAALTHYGFQSLYFTPEHTGNKKWVTAFEMIKAAAIGQCWCIALVVGTVNGGQDNFWTSGGHFLAITDYNAKKNEIYVRDSGSRGHTGWYKADALKFDTNAIWIIAEEM